LFLFLCFLYFIMKIITVMSEQSLLYLGIMESSFMTNFP